MESVKLQKYFTDCGLLSRRAAEREIAAGHVTVNGTPAYLGQRILPEQDTVLWRGKPVQPLQDQKYYLLLHKPRGVLTTMSDDRGRPTVAPLVASLGARVYPVGRLDMDSEGLLLMTNDGDLAMRLTHPRHEIPKIYHVTVSGTVSAEQLHALNDSMVIDGYRILPVKTLVVASDAHTTTLQMTLYEGRNRQIRNMCALCNLRVRRLVRVAIGSITLTPDLPAGKWRHLTDAELRQLQA